MLRLPRNAFSVFLSTILISAVILWFSGNFYQLYSALKGYQMHFQRIISNFIKAKCLLSTINKIETTSFDNQETKESFHLIKSFSSIYLVDKRETKRCLWILYCIIGSKICILPTMPLLMHHCNNAINKNKYSSGCNDSKVISLINSITQSWIEFWWNTAGTLLGHRSILVLEWNVNWKFQFKTLELMKVDQQSCDVCCI